MHYTGNPNASRPLSLLKQELILVSISSEEDSHRAPKYEYGPKPKSVYPFNDQYLIASSPEVLGLNPYGVSDTK